jgi:hypothetical protein
MPVRISSMVTGVWNAIGSLPVSLQSTVRSIEVKS